MKSNHEKEQAHEQIAGENTSSGSCAEAERVIVLNTLNLVSQQLNNNLPLEQALMQIIEQVRKNPHYISVDLYLLNATRDTLLPVQNRDEAAGKCPVPHSIPLDHPDDPSACAVREKRAVMPPTSEMQASPTPTGAADVVIAIPITEETYPIGSLTVHTTGETGLGICDSYLLQSLAHQISTAMTYARLTKEIEEARRAASIAERAKSEFLSRMSHELRTPLNGILGYAQILKRTPELSTMQRHGLDIIQQSGEHLLTIINDILDFTRIEAHKFDLQPGNFNLDNFLKKVTDNISTHAQNKGLDFILETQPPLPQGLHADESRLQRVLLNLLNNAVKYTQQGSITLRVQTIKSSQEQKGTKTLRFTVSDTGVGIAEDDLHKIFTPFEPIENNKVQSEGIGLGLALADQIVRIMGGTLQVESKVGQGSTFWFDVALPIADTPPRAAESASSQAIIGYAGARRKILIADDKDYNRVLLRSILAPLGFDISEAEDGLACIQMAQQTHPDLIIMDMIMPGLTGFEATQKIREIAELQDIIILGTSASIFEEDRKKVTLTGCNAFLSKPMDIRQLFAMLQELLHIEWLYKEKIPSAHTDLAQIETIIPPSQAELSNLYEIAKLGNMRKVSAWAEALSARDATYRPFADKIRNLAHNFQKKQIVTLIEDYLEA